jgi:pimeloyl-ACP methyl ester carboxylesterase
MIIEGAGHFAQSDAHAEFTSAVRSRLASRAARRI